MTLAAAAAVTSQAVPVPSPCSLAAAVAVAVTSLAVVVPPQLVVAVTSLVVAAFAGQMQAAAEAAGCLGYHGYCCCMLGPCLDLARGLNTRKGSFTCKVSKYE